MISIFLEEGLPAAEALSELLDQKQLESVDPGYVHKILTAFSSGYLDSIRSKPAPDVLISPLSERELEILQLINEGLSNQEITERLTISLHTVKKHSSNIYLKLGVNSRTQAVARARKLGLL
ncbi:MAG: response regulator transcription factor [Anaerolineales bacterium]|nr:response regulator transcription factor [Anaerolineales bacterium]